MEWNWKSKTTTKKKTAKKNTRVKVRSSDGDTDYFDIAVGVRQGDTSALYLFIICQDYVLRTFIDKIKNNGFKMAKKRSRKYPAQTIMDADYADDRALLAETQLHSLERAAAGIALHINANKTKYVCFNQKGDISTLNGSSLNLLDKFTYIGSSVSSTETDINTRLAKVWTANDRLLVIWKSKRSFIQAVAVLILLYGCTTWILTKHIEKILTAITQECCEQYWTSSGGSTQQSSSRTETYHPSRKLSKLDEPDMRDTAGEVRTNS